MRLKELIEKRQEAVKNLRKFADAKNVAGYEFTAEDQAQFEGLQKEFTNYESAITREKKIDEMESHVEQNANFNDSRPAIFQDKPDTVSLAERKLAFQGWMKGPKQKNKITREQAQAMGKLGLDLQQPEMVINLCGTEEIVDLQTMWRNGTPDQRQALLRGRIGAAGLLTTGSTAGTGFIPPGTMATQFEAALLAYGHVRRYAETYRTSDHGPFKVPTENDTSNTGEIVSEQSSIGSTVDPTISSKTYGLYKYSSKLVKYTSEMAEDPAFNLTSWLADKLGIRLARITNTKHTTGAGTTEPSGLTIDGTSGLTAAATTAVTLDELLDLIESVDPEYRDGSVFMAKSAVFTAVRKIKDGGSGYLWTPNVSQAANNQLFGYDTVVNQAVPAMTATLKPIIFGNLFKYKIRALPEVRVVRTTELYLATDEQGMIAFLREDSGLLDAGTHPVKFVTMHA